MMSSFDSDNPSEDGIILVPFITPIQEIIAVGHFAANETGVPDHAKLTFLKMAAIRWQEQELLNCGRAPDPQITEASIREQFTTAFATSSAREFIARLEGSAWEQKRLFDDLRERLGNVANEIKISLGLPWYRVELNSSAELVTAELDRRAMRREIDEWDFSN